MDRRNNNKFSNDNPKFLRLIKFSNKSKKEGRDIGLFITLVPKFENNDFLFIGLTTLETFIEFWLVRSSTINGNLQKG